MIEKILSELQALKEDAVDKWDGGASHRAYTKAIQIVQEVAKEYEEKKYYRITLACLEDGIEIGCVSCTR